MKASNEFCQSAMPRPTVEVLLPDGRILCGPRNRPIAAFLKGLPEWNQHDPIMGAVINGELRELTHPVELDEAAALNEALKRRNRKLKEPTLGEREAFKGLIREAKEPILELSAKIATLEAELDAAVEAAWAGA